MKNKKATLMEVAPQIEVIAGILNIFNKNPKDFLNLVTEKRLKLKNIDRNDILRLIEDRNTAKADKDYQRSDEIREELNKMGVIIQDTADGVEWRL